MGKIYVGQTALRIQLTTNIDVSSATTNIKYQKPDGTTGQWSAAVLDKDRGIIFYDVVDSTILDQEGEWIVWAHVTFSNGKVAAGEPVTLNIYSEGD